MLIGYCIMGSFTTWDWPLHLFNDLRVGNSPVNSKHHGTGPSIDGSVDAAGAWVLNIHEDSLSLSHGYIYYIYYQINIIKSI